MLNITHIQDVDKRKDAGLTFYSRSCEHSAQFVASKLILF
ncbi:hypothetical protein CSC12_0588 [Klebsiella michiganensis]|nr:hypothetical protein CSC12_0588 [Klebsiella michiganensis]